MGKFEEQFYSSQIEDWKDYYLKYDVLKNLINNIYNELSNNTITNNRIDLLIKTNKKMNDSDESTNSYFMKIIENNYPELDNIPNESYIKNFIAELEKQVHSIYLFYLNIEKEIYLKINSKLFLHKFEGKNDEEIISEIDELINISYLIFSFYTFTNNNIDAIDKILSKFDKKLNQYYDFSIKSMYFKNNLLKENSDIKYMLLFKIIIESNAILEHFTRDFKKHFPNKRNILNKNLELLNVINNINDKNTNLLNNSLFETYIINKNTSLIKNKMNFNNYIQNSFIISTNKNQDDNKYTTFEEEEYDKKINIIVTRRNKINIIICLFHTFFSSFFYIIPYINFTNFYNQKSYHLKYIGLILSFTHIGNYLSNFLFLLDDINFKSSLIISCFLFIYSMISFVIIDVFVKNNIIYSTLLLSIARLIYGIGSGKVIARKYILMYLPQSEIPMFSIIYILCTNLGFILGNLSNFFFEKEIIIFSYKINHFFIYIIGLCLFFFYIFTIIFLFTEPSISDESFPMLNQDFENKINKEIEKIDIELENDLKERLLSKSKIKEYNTIEEGIINLHNLNKFNDFNLMSQAIEKLKKKQFNNSRTFWKGFLLITSSLFIVRCISEFTLLFYVIDKNDNTIIINFNILLFGLIPYELFIRKKLNISYERKSIVLYFFLLLITYVVEIIIINIFKRNDLLIIFCISKIILCSSIEGVINIIIEKLFHSNIKIAFMFIKHWFLFSSNFGRFVASIIFFCLIDNENYKFYSELVFFIFSLLLFLLLIIFNNSLRVRAINKLIFIN